MRLSRLEIQNFRGISSMTMEFERDITVLIGENNSGKTSVLDAIRFGLDSIKSTKSCAFSEFDFHRNSPSIPLSQCPEVVFTFHFEETDDFPWNEDILRLLDPIIIGDVHSGIKLRLKGWFDTDSQELAQDWSFLDDQGNEMPGKKDVIKDIRKLRPFFSLSALRVAKDEFRTGSYWNSFVKNKDIDNALRTTLEGELSNINQRIIDAHTSFKDVTTEVKRISQLVSVASQDAVSIDPARSDVYQALRSAEVNLLTGTNAKIPVRNHGEGTQSISVLLLFSAYLKTRLTADFDRNAEPIVAIEEPESHLHPNAIRALWSVLKNLPGQKFIATHSGDILSEVPIQAIRRLNKISGNSECRNVSNGVLEDEELRKFNHHVRRNRGELLFARKWLLVEGETDVSVFTECAEILQVNFNQLGIRIVECSQAGGPGIFIKAADALGIEWHLVADNDDGGQKYVTSAQSLLAGKEEANHISKLTAPNTDILLCISGYGEPYKKGFISQQKQSVRAQSGNATWDNVLEEIKRIFPTKPNQALKVIKKMQDRSVSLEIPEEGSLDYWKYVYKNLPSRFSKPAAALEALELMRTNGVMSVPPEVRAIVEKITSSQVGV